LYNYHPTAILYCKYIDNLLLRLEFSISIQICEMSISIMDVGSSKNFSNNNADIVEIYYYCVFGTLNIYISNGQLNL